MIVIIQALQCCKSGVFWQGNMENMQVGGLKVEFTFILSHGNKKKTFPLIKDANNVTKNINFKAGVLTNTVL